MNLLKETIECLEKHAKTINDVLWVGTTEARCSVSEFIKIADKTDYYDGYGGQEIAADLLVVGKDWWLERHEYDGSEWWEFKSQPVIPEVKFILKTLERETGYETKLLKMNGFEK